MAIRTSSGQQPSDVTGVPIPAPTAFVCTDGAAPSPLTVTDTEVDIAVPANAIRFVAKATLADCRVAIKDGTGTNYFILYAGDKDVFPCAGMTHISVKRDAAVSVVLVYRFDLLS